MNTTAQRKTIATNQINGKSVLDTSGLYDSLCMCE